MEENKVAQVVKELGNSLVHRNGLTFLDATKAEAILRSWLEQVTKQQAGRICELEARLEPQSEDTYF